MSPLLERYSRRLFSNLILGSTLLVIGACANKKPGPTSMPVAQETWMSKPINVPPEAQTARPVRQGKLPLVYLVETATTVRIVDVTNSAELLLLPVQGKTTISLTENNGLRVGGAPMRFLTLPGDHVYEIYLQSSVSNPNQFRTSTVRPAPAAPSNPQTPANPQAPAATPPGDVVQPQPLLPNSGTFSGGTP